MITWVYDETLVGDGRRFDDHEFNFFGLDRLHAQYGFGTVIESDARGADRIAGSRRMYAGLSWLSARVPKFWRSHYGVVTLNHRPKIQRHG